MLELSPRTRIWLQLPVAERTKIRKYNPSPASVRALHELFLVLPQLTWRTHVARKKNGRASKRLLHFLYLYVYAREVVLCVVPPLVSSNTG